MSGPGGPKDRPEHWAECVAGRGPERGAVMLLVRDIGLLA